MLSPGISDGFKLEGRRIYRFPRSIPCLEIVWGSNDSGTNTTVEIEFGTEAAAPDAGAPDVKRSTNHLVGRRGKVVLGAAGESFDFNTFPRWTSEFWDGSTDPLLGARGEVPRAFRALARATTALPFSLVLVDPTFASGTIDVLLAEVASVTRPGTVSTATACVECIGAAVQSGIRLPAGSPNVTVEVALWALFD